MGLSINGVSWSYSGFGMWRSEIARHEGFELKEMDGFGGDRPWDEISSVLKPLLSHSDCDGVLTAQECAAMYQRLREVVDELWPAWDESEMYSRVRGIDLADVMQWAAENGDELEFA
jgi:hypothetical protein